MLLRMAVLLRQTEVPSVIWLAPATQRRNVVAQTGWISTAMDTGMELGKSHSTPWGYNVSTNN